MHKYKEFIKNTGYEGILTINNALPYIGGMILESRIAGVGSSKTIAGGETRGIEGLDTASAASRLINIKQ